MLATLKRHRLTRPALLLALVLALTGAAGMTQPAQANPQDCMDACDASLTWCEASCPIGHGRLPCLADCREAYKYCTAGCSA